jgi:1-acyl-sn-glycerol-3-phosphate acyltransferase
VIKILKHCRGVIVFAGFTINTIICFTPIFILALVKLLLPITVIRREISKLLMAIGEAWISINTLLLSSLGSIDWQGRGHERLDRDAWYLLIANHQTWVDILVLQKVFNRRIPFLKFFIKQQLIWFPMLGIAWWALDMPFMKRYSKSHLAKYPHKKGQDLEATRKACAKFRDTPTTVINFIEGTRFSEEKHAARGSPYKYLLPPRAGGVALAMASMGELFDSILDVTIVYPDGPAKFWDMCCGHHVRVIVDVRPRSIEAQLISGDYEGDREHRREFHRWLTEVWQEKDQRIAVLLEETRSTSGPGNEESDRANPQ